MGNREASTGHRGISTGYNGILTPESANLRPGCDVTGRDMTELGFRFGQPTNDKVVAQRIGGSEEVALGHPEQKPLGRIMGRTCLRVHSLVNFKND